MAVVVDDDFLAEFFAANDESGWPIRSVPDYFTNNVLSRYAWSNPGVPGIRAGIFRSASSHWRAGAKRSCDCTGANGLEQFTPENSFFVSHRMISFKPIGLLVLSHARSSVAVRIRCLHWVDCNNHD